MSDVLLYTRAGCHLCDDAQQILVEYGLTPTLIDIDTDPQLAARYGHVVPVVVIDGRERFRGRIEPRLLARLIRGRRRAAWFEWLGRWVGPS